MVNAILLIKFNLKDSTVNKPLRVFGEHRTMQSPQ